VEDFNGVNAMRDRIEYYETISNALEKRITKEQHEQLRSAIERLRCQSIIVSAFGETNAGKSSLLNALHGGPNPPFKTSAEINHWSADIEATNACNWQSEEGWKVILKDTPGIAGDFSEHAEKAMKIVSSSDIIVYVVWQPVKGEAQINAFKAIQKTGKPVLVALSKTDIQRPEEIEATHGDLITKFPDLLPESIVRVSGNPINGAPDVGRLKATLLEFVRQGRESLVLKTLDSISESAMADAKAKLEADYQAEVKAQSESFELRESDRISRNAIGIVVLGRYAKVASAAAGALPLGIDFLSTTVVTGGMLYNLARVHAVDMDAKTLTKMGKELIESLVLVMFVSMATFAGYQALSKGLKSNPMSYVAGMALDAAFTYFIMMAIGNAFNFYCLNEKSWADKGSMQAYLRGWVSENIDTMFLNRLPKRARQEFEKRFGTSFGR
jgi:50S ribosome-binding GTPase/Domain of unknown function (DUF697)